MESGTCIIRQQDGSTPETRHVSIKLRFDRIWRWWWSVPGDITSKPLVKRRWVATHLSLNARPSTSHPPPPHGPITAGHIHTHTPELHSTSSRCFEEVYPSPGSRSGNAEGSLARSQNGPMPPSPIWNSSRGPAINSTASQYRGPRVSPSCNTTRRGPVTSTWRGTTRTMSLPSASRPILTMIPECRISWNTPRYVALRSAHTLFLLAAARPLELTRLSDIPFATLSSRCSIAVCRTS